MIISYLLNQHDLLSIIYYHWSIGREKIPKFPFFSHLYYELFVFLRRIGAKNN